MQIRQASPTEMDVVRRLFREYAEELNVDLCFQSFENELATLPGKYAQPGGAILLADIEGEIVGVVALRPLPDLGAVCEMKRMYVVPSARRTGAGRVLAESLIKEAQRIGYDAMVLDTLERMAPAVKLYESLGFERVEDYYGNDLPDAVFFRLDFER